MAVRRTKRGAERTRIDGSWDVVVCGGSFAGLAVARELAGAPARVLMIDRYEIGERQTSACAAPTAWLEALGLEGSIRQTFHELVMRTPGRATRYRLPWAFSTFDYRTLCLLLAERTDATFETATVRGRSGHTLHTDRGDVSAPLLVDALGWRRVLSAGAGHQPPEAPLSRGLEVHPEGSGADCQLWIDRRYVPAGYGWSFPAGEEVRVGVGSFDPRFHVKEPTLALSRDLEREPIRFQGNWIPHRLRPAAEDGVFFCGDSAGHCLPLTAEGIRTALYFGAACGREIRAVLEGRATPDEALRRHAAFSARHARAFRLLLGLQRLLPRIPPLLLGPAIGAMRWQPFVDWGFRRYLALAPPSFAGDGGAAAALPPADERLAA